MPESSPAVLATMTLDELQQKLQRQEQFHLVETLAPEYYNHTHLPGAINVPTTRIHELAPQVLPERNAQIVVYCASNT